LRRGGNIVTARDAFQEVWELGLRGTAFRVYWEMKTRGGSALARIAPPAISPQPSDGSARWTVALPFADPAAVAGYMRDIIGTAALLDLERDAGRASHGVIRAFGRWTADYGDPIDWHLNPVNGRRWDSTKFWTAALNDEPRVGDVKLTWEVARFPHFFLFGRAGAFFQDQRRGYAAAAAQQIEAFEAANPFEHGIHWNSGQEIAIRLIAWLFALDTLLRSEPERAVAGGVADHVRRSVHFIEAHIDYARIAVYNNHILAEALALYVFGLLFAGEKGGRELRDTGRRILIEETNRQFYPGGAYIQLSHNYHRVALQCLMLASVFARHNADAPAPEWIAAMERSLDFLLAHQNESDGRLPNYGSNDGALPLPLTSCDFSDFRPTLQAVSLLSRGERIYDRGPWDEEAAWLLGPLQVDGAPLRRRPARSSSFRTGGFHVLRAADPGTFLTFRCGTIHDRFSQIDMLHVDCFWRGENVLVDGGTYLYNGPEEWHDHFMETGSHNTIVVDGLDQMKHFRKFKCLYWPEAKLLDFRRVGDVTFAAGEHFGYGRHPGACVHRRSVALHDDGIGVVVDTVEGEGRHKVRLHWLFGEFPYEFDAGKGTVTLATPKGRFSLAAQRDCREALEATVVCGAERPPRGWYSRYFGEKVPVPSLVVEGDAELPVRFITGFGPGEVEVKRKGQTVRVCAGVGNLSLRVDADGLLAPA
jgi:Heparinase II/III-like protein/Heparinase II/III N-terminus